MNENGEVLRLQGVYAYAWPQPRLGRSGVKEGGRDANSLVHRFSTWPLTDRGRMLNDFKQRLEMGLRVGIFGDMYRLPINATVLWRVHTTVSITHCGTTLTRCQGNKVRIQTNYYSYTTLLTSLEPLVVEINTYCRRAFTKVTHKADDRTQLSCLSHPKVLACA